MSESPEPRNVLKFENDGPLLLASNYWQSEMAAVGKLYVAINAGYFACSSLRASTLSFLICVPEPNTSSSRCEVGLEACSGSLAGFELTVEEEGGIREFFRGEAEGGAKEDLGRPAPGQGHEADAILEVTVVGQEFESRLDEGFWIQGE
jgi:hypothetical protein